MVGIGWLEKVMWLEAIQLVVASQLRFHRLATTDPCLVGYQRLGHGHGEHPSQIQPPMAHHNLNNQIVHCLHWGSPSQRPYHHKLSNPPGSDRLTKLHSPIAHAD